LRQKRKTQNWERKKEKGSKERERELGGSSSFFFELNAFIYASFICYILECILALNIKS
jgi:hypothetical protein